MRLIEVDALKEKLDKIPARSIENADGRAYVLIRLSTVLEIIKQLPSTETERKKGKWLIILTFNDCYYAKCDQCHKTQVFYYNKPLTNFCPNCGCDMREGD